MELKVIEKKDNALLSRTELVLEGIQEGATPSYDVLKKKIAGQFKADERLIAIKHIYPLFGTTKIKVIAYVYSDKETMENIEPAVEEKKEKPKPVEKKEEKPVTEKPAEKKEEKPAKAGQETPAEAEEGGK